MQNLELQTFAVNATPVLVFSGTGHFLSGPYVGSGSVRLGPVSTFNPAALDGRLIEPAGGFEFKAPVEIYAAVQSGSGNFTVQRWF